jgi:predicted dehydrogenase
MSSYTRRRFLEDSLFAAAAAAIGPATVCAAEKRKKKGSDSPNERLGVAVVGVRGQGNGHLGAFTGRKDTEVLYVVDADESVGQKRAEEVGKRQGRTPKWVADLRQAFDDKAVNLVSTATPNHWHALVAIWAMQAGKDVYVEKPVSHNVSEGRRAVETARKHGRMCQTGTQCRSMQGTIEAIEYVQSGKIGEVKLARGLCYKRRASIGPRGTYEVPKNVNYDLWSGPAPILPLTRPNFHYDWHWQWPYGNGDLGNQGIHQMDIARWGLGVATISSRVFSYGGRLGYEDAGDTANTQVICHEFANGKTLVFEVRGLETPDLMGAKVGVIFYGSDGYVVLSSYTSGVALDKNLQVVKKFNGGGDHFDNFVQAVRSRKHDDLHADILQGHLSSALCHTGNISYRLGQSIAVAEAKKRLAGLKTGDKPLETFARVTDHLKANKVEFESAKLIYGAELMCDPQGELFPGNEKANAMLTREYRKPFVVPAAGQA